MLPPESDLVDNLLDFSLLLRLLAVILLGGILLREVVQNSLDHVDIDLSELQSELEGRVRIMGIVVR